MKELLAGLAASLCMALPAATQALAEGRRGDPAFGEYLSTECVTCHQASGRIETGVPSIVGWPEDQFVAVMQAYRSKDRDNRTMQAIAGRLSSEDIESLAAYFGGLKAQTAR